MSDWTAERLDALPEHTGIVFTMDRLPKVGMRSQHFFIRGHGVWNAEDILIEADPGSIRVVSVPIDALLSDEALEAATDAFVMTTNLAGTLGDEAERAIRAAVAHVTGGSL